MENKIKVLGILLLAGFSFFYTSKVTNIIKENDPIMQRINESKKDMIVSKIDPIVMKDEYIPGINGCIVDEEESYNKMKNVGTFKEDLVVMKEDKIEKIDNKYIIGGNKKKRNVSIILLEYNENLESFFRKQKINVSYFLDAEYIINNIDKIISINNNSKVYNFGRNKKYSSKYIVYDNSVIETNLNNKSNYCLFEQKDVDSLKICTYYKMKSIKDDFIKDDILIYVKENLKNGKIFIFDSDDYDNVKISIKYIQSKGYNIVTLDDLLSENNTCK